MATVHERQGAARVAAKERLLEDLEKQRTQTPRFMAAPGQSRYTVPGATAHDVMNTGHPELIVDPYGRDRVRDVHVRAIAGSAEARAHFRRHGRLQSEAWPGAVGVLIAIVTFGALYYSLF